ncbi:MAG: hypothetical protein HYY40_10435 [Bacteroidetes bacterium]|nr:hypothetical protein [Bacteroidota bacterium]
MKSTLLSLLTLVAISAGGITGGFAQCKTFTKKCLPKLQPYIHNGQLNSTTLAESETAELMMTFYSGQNYRIQICAQDVLGNVQFSLLDQDRNVIFDNKEHNFSDHWDFNVNSTMRFIISVSIPAPDSKAATNQIVQSGCVSVLVGFKD